MTSKTNGPVFLKVFDGPSCKIPQSVAAENSCKVATKREPGRMHVYNASKSQSSCELFSSYMNNVSLMITSIDTETDDCQRISLNIPNVAQTRDYTAARYHSQGQSQRLTLSPNPETGENKAFRLDSTSQESKSEHIRSSQTAAEFLLKETSPKESYKDNLTCFRENGHQTGSNIKTSVINLCSSSTPGEKTQKEISRSSKKRKLLKRGKVHSAVIENWKLSTKALLGVACRRKTWKVNPPVLVSDTRNQCVTSEHHSKVSTGPKANSSQMGPNRMNRVDPLKAETIHEKCGGMAKGSAEALQSDTNDKLLKTPFTENVPNSQLKGDASFQLSMRSTFNNREKDKRSASAPVGVTASDSRRGESLGMDIDIQGSLKTDRSTQYCNEDCLTTLNKNTARKFISCRYCRQTFRRVSAYTARRRIRTGEKPHRGKVCGKNFSRLSKLRSCRNVHVQSTPRPCPRRRKTFAETKDLGAHFPSRMTSSKQNTEPDDQQGKSQSSSRDLRLSKSVTVNIYEQFNSIYEQFILKHSRVKPLSCTTCGKEFRTSSQLAVHEKTHWPVKPYACSICAKGFKRIGALKKHSQKHTGDATFSCSRCGRAFRDLSTLRVHQISKVCDRKQDFKGRESDLEGFLVTYGVDGQVNTPVFFKCQICKRLYQTWCQYTLHLRTHTSSQRPYLCLACGQSYIKDSELKVHCSVCCQASGEEAACASSFPEILKIDVEKSLAETESSPNCAEQPSPWRFKCPRCGQRYKRYKTLCLHMKTHAPAFRHVCRPCGRSFERWNKLWLHRRTHRRKGSRLTCSECNLQFDLVSSFKTHLLGHTEGRPYQCPFCLQTFANKEALHMHQCSFVRSTKKIQCDVCARRFSNATNFIKHSLLHNGAGCHLRRNRSKANQSPRERFDTHHNIGSPQASIPSEPLTFSHKCNTCKSSFSDGDLLYAHQICHSTESLVPSTEGSGGLVSTTSRSLLSTLDLDAIPNESLFKYPHPDKLYLPPRLSGMFPSIPNVNIDLGQKEASPNSVSPNSRTGQSITREYTTTEIPPQPQLLECHESVQSQCTEEIPVLLKQTVTDHLQDEANRNTSQRIDLGGMSVFLEGPSTTVKAAENKMEDETFECADCSEILGSVTALHGHYFLHALAFSRHPYPELPDSPM